jgi:acetolactate synthase-1/2/3 large subunit
MTMMTGAEIVIRCLQEEKVEYVFGYPGGAVLHIYDALFKQDQVKHVLVRHEQAAVHAADGLHVRPTRSASLWSPRALARPMP